ncbi:hypothetical protein M404DRAFT_999701 [Pisolithus tinctorius Marx 270]|uniref:Uncharacterized protein n=1 Tax=Pisolithus tinctorius Marx 270 TaxID=870435 RepID=A0A0C3NXF0_PISTI|nr:hypothetical protein M404DRAFT_999701 [Pisolithus tinctorius Marx 270]
MMKYDKGRGLFFAFCCHPCPGPSLHNRAHAPNRRGRSFTPLDQLSLSGKLREDTCRIWSLRPLQ